MQETYVPMEGAVPEMDAELNVTAKYDYFYISSPIWADQITKDVLLFNGTPGGVTCSQSNSIFVPADTVPLLSGLKFKLQCFCIY